MANNQLTKAEEELLGKVLSARNLLPVDYHEKAMFANRKRLIYLKKGKFLDAFSENVESSHEHFKIILDEDTMAQTKQKSIADELQKKFENLSKCLAMNQEQNG